MQAVDRATLLWELVSLASVRPQWLEPISANLTVHSDQEATVTTNFVLDSDFLESQINGMLVSGQPLAGNVVVLPIFRSTRSTQLQPEELSVTTTAGTYRPEILRSSQLSHRLPISAPLPPGFEKERLVSLDADVLRHATEVSVTVPFLPADEIVVERGLRRVVAAFNPVGLMDLELDASKGISTLCLRMPFTVHTTQMVLAYDAGLGEWLEQIRYLKSSYDQFGQPIVRGPIATREITEIRRLLKGAKDALDRTSSSLESAHQLSATDVPIVELRTAITRLDELDEGASDSLDRVQARVAATGNEYIALKELLRVVDGAVKTCGAVETINVLSRCERDSESDDASLTVPTCRELRLAEVGVVYSTRVTSIKRRRRSTAASLFVLGAVLGLIAWRFAVLPPLVRHGATQIELVRSDAILTSREALVALLVIFPALLYSQLERAEARSDLLDRSVGPLLTAGAVAFAIPILIAILSLGDPRPNLVIWACVAGAAGLWGTAMLLWGIFRGSLLRRLRARAARRRLSR